MDLTRLRNLLVLQLPSLKDSVTHPRLAGLCKQLDLPPPPPEEPGVSKLQRLEKSFEGVKDAELPNVAQRLLSLRPLAPQARHAIEDIIWSAQNLEVPRRIRRELARGLDLGDLYRDPTQFEKILDQFWILDDDPIDDFIFGGSHRSLRNRLEKNVFQNPNWSVEELFEQLGAFNAPSARFARFIEALASSEVQQDEPAQRHFVARTNPHVRACNVELRETGIAEGYPIFSLAVLSDRSFGAPKQLIFASPIKPDIRFQSAVDNDIEIVTNADRVLVYDQPIGLEGLSWNSLQQWWRERENLTSDLEAKQTLFRRLQDGLPANSPPQRRLFRSYFEAFKAEIPTLPALLPEVWLHWDPRTVRERGVQALTRFRMDFLMLLPRGIRVVIEVDGKTHYADADGKVSPQLYGRMVAADRDLKLAGYEVFRFGTDALKTDNLVLVKDFFDRLFDRFAVR